MRQVLMLIVLMHPILWCAEDSEVEALLTRSIGPRVSEKNADSKFIEAEMQRINDGYAKDGLITALFHPTRELHSAELQMLFPDAKFYVLRYDMRATKKGLHRVSCALGLGFTLVVFDGHCEVLQQGGNGEGFAKFLAKYKIGIQTESDARLISNVLEQLSFGREARNPKSNQKFSDTEWHLDIQMRDDSTYYYQLNTTKDGLCLSGKSCCVQANKPSEKKK